ncbi:hypothetical protein EYF80_023298 [Liparis tanakae]|uniref:Uncharacterized protein n=1 Tax=Liparis tanakae TaxID=230148 RepID=A0A4Z2HMJ5_9TELE|nr:hypothetical protein EYF80_023298 [Liparis tanakae]
MYYMYPYAVVYVKTVRIPQGRPYNRLMMPEEEDEVVAVTEPQRQPELNPGDKGRPPWSGLFRDASCLVGHPPASVALPSAMALLMPPIAPMENDRIESAWTALRGDKHPGDL